jgi:hypothetical protein
MAIRHPAAIGAAAFILSVRIAHAGPCAEAIERLQDEFDARIEAAIDTARFVRDARRAFGLPSPRLGAATGGSRDDASWMGQAVAALAQARDADRSGDHIACEQAVGEAQRAIGR